MTAPASGITPPQTSFVLQLNAAAYADLGSSLQVSFLGASPFTFEGWFRFGGLCPDSVLIEKPGEFTLGTKGATIYAQRNGQLFPIQTPPVLNTTDWFHIAAAFDGATLGIYVDGLLSVSTTTIGPGIASQGQPFKLGTAFQGQIDSFRVWNTGRTGTQLYQGEWATLPAQSGVLADYDFSQNPPADLSGNNNPITLRAGAASLSLTPAVGVIGAGYCEPIEDAATVNPGGGGSDPYTIIAWVNLDVTDGVQCIFANGDLAGSGGIFLSVANGVVTAQRGGSSPTTLSSASSLGANAWYCVALTYDGTTQSIYINGALDASAAAGAIPAMTQGDLTIAAAFSSQSAVAANSFQGHLQFVSVWNICLPAAQIVQWQYHNPTDQAGVVANYSFAGNSATNLQTSNPVGLAAGAQLVQLQGAVSAVRDGPAPRGRPSPLQPAVDLTAADIAERQAFYSADRRAALIAEYGRALPPHMPRAARAAAIAELSAELDGLANPGSDAAGKKLPQFTAELDRDHWSFRRTMGDDVTELLRVPQAQLSACAAAQVSLLLASVNTTLAIMGVGSLDASAASQFFNVRVGDAGFGTALTYIVRLPLTASSVLKVIALLWDFGMFATIIEALLNGMRWWDWVTLGLRIIAIVSPLPSYQKAYAVGKLIVALWSLKQAFDNANKAC